MAGTSFKFQITNANGSLIFKECYPTRTLSTVR
jgi:hypothetical protein